MRRVILLAVLLALASPALATRHARGTHVHIINE